FSVFPPGWPLVLALGMRLGLPWVVNPLLAGAAVVVMHTLVRRTINRNAADVAAVMLASSPSFLFASATYMSHTMSITCALVALLSIDFAASAKSVARRWGWGALAGATSGLLFLTRPVEGVILGVAAGAWVVGSARRHAARELLLVGIPVGTLVASLFF